MTPEERIEFYNFKTETNLERLRENLTYVCFSYPS